jgi:hypothetical protein
VISIASGGTAAPPAEGIYWSGVKTCTGVGTALTAVDILSTTGLLLFFVDATKKINSDLSGVYDFAVSILEDVKASASAYGESSNYYACSKDMEISAYSVSDVHLGLLDLVGHSKAQIDIHNNGLVLDGVARVVVEILRGDRVVGIYSSDNITISAGSTQSVEIDLPVPNSHLLFADKYTARFILMSSGGIQERIGAFRVCSPLACFMDDITNVMSGQLSSGETTSSQFQTNGGQKVVSFTMSYPGSDLDLHIYDASGQHTGVDYQTGKIEFGIPGSSYSGNTRNPETISITEPGAQEFKVEVVAVTTERAESFSVLAVSEIEHAATLTATPPELRVNLGGSDSTCRGALTIVEMGRQNGAEILNWSISDFVGSRQTLPTSCFSIFFPAANISPGASLTGEYSFHLATQAAPDTFRGALSIKYENASLVIPVTLVVGSGSVSVDQGILWQPTEFALRQNYPNPFNPSTRIEYALPRKVWTTLVVYDALGQPVRTLVNEEKEAGLHDVEFGTKGLSSGVYFYRLRAGDFVQTKKLLLLK